MKTLLLTLNDEEYETLTRSTNDLNIELNTNISKQKFIIKLVKDYDDEKNKPVKK